MKMSNIQNDLKNGETIENTCTKYGISFGEMVELFHGYNKKVINSKNSKGKPKTYNRVTPSSEPFIYIRGGTYAVRKSIKGKTKIFGTYDSMEDAVKVREALKVDGWHQTHVDRICEELGVARRKGHQNEKVRYS